MSEFNLTELGGEEYESLPDSVSPLIHALAGSIAGICEHTAMFPLDTVKTRLQKIKGNTNHNGTWHTLKNIYYNESPRTLFRGIGAVASGAGPAHAVYFSAYEHSKVVLGIADNPSAHPAATACAGIVATLCHEATMNPVEVVKQRMQMQGSTFSGTLSNKIYGTIAANGDVLLAIIHQQSALKCNLYFGTDPFVRSVGVRTKHIQIRRTDSVLQVIPESGNTSYHALIFLREHPLC